MNAKRLGDGFRRCHEAEAFEFGGRSEAAGRAAWIATRGKLGAYLSLKLRLPATRVAPLAVGSAPAPFLSRRAKSLSVAGCQRDPGLKITGRGFEREKRNGGEGREPIGLEIVELDEA